MKKNFFSNLWDISNSVRGSLDGWDFRTYLLTILSYRTLSEYMRNVVNRDFLFDSGDFSDWNGEIPEKFKKQIADKYGFYLSPKDLFSNFIKTAKENNNLAFDIKEVLNRIEESSSLTDRHVLRDAFADFKVDNYKLGANIEEKNDKIRKILEGVNLIKIQPDENFMDIFGDAYEFLVSKYSENAGKSGGEFFTPPSVSSLISNLIKVDKTNFPTREKWSATLPNWSSFGVDKSNIKSIYDPACGTGSLLLNKNGLSSYNEIDFYGQDINYSSTRMAVINLLLHGVNYKRINIETDNTLTSPCFSHKAGTIDVVVANPPFSLSWAGSDNKDLLNDPRFSSAGTLPPKSKADFAFILDGLHMLNGEGSGYFICFPGILYRTGAEEKIRKYLVDNNLVKSVILLPPNLFYNTTTNISLLVISKNKKNENITFINGEIGGFYTKKEKNNILTQHDIERILEAYQGNEKNSSIAITTTNQEVKDNDYSLYPARYLEVSEEVETINIKALTQEIDELTREINSLRMDVDRFIKLMDL